MTTILPDKTPAEVPKKPPVDEGVLPYLFAVAVIAVLLWLWSPWQ